MSPVSVLKILGTVGQVLLTPHGWGSIVCPAVNGRKGDSMARNRSSHEVGAASPVIAATLAAIGISAMVGAVLGSFNALCSALGGC